MRSSRILQMAAMAGLVILFGGCRQQPAGETTAAPAYRVYVTNEQSGDLAIINGSTGVIEKTVPLGRRPRGIRRSPDGHTLYIALSGSPIAGPGVDESKLPPPDKRQDGIAVFDVATQKVSRVIRGSSDPEQLAVSSSGRLFIASEDTGKAVVIDIASGRVIASIDVGAEPEGVSLSPDEKTVWVTSEEDAQVTVIDTTSLRPIRTIPVGKRPRNTRFSPDGRTAYISGELDRSISVVDVATLTVANRIVLPGDASVRPMGLAMSPDGRRLYISTGRGKQVVILDTATRAVTGSVTVGQRPWGIVLSPDGTRLYTANGPSNDVSVVDTRTLAAVATIPTGKSPWGVEVIGK